MISLAQMRQSNGYVGVRNTFNLHLGSFSQHALPPARHQPDPLTPSAQTTIQEETKNPGKRSSSPQIVSYCLELRTQNPVLKKVNLEPSPKRDSDKINRPRPRRKNTTENKSYRRVWTHKRKPST